MTKCFVRDLEPNKTITSSFLVQSKEIRQKKTGEPFLCLVLSDRTGEVEARMWDNAAEAMDLFDRDDFVQVKGLVQMFHNRPQLILHKLRRMDESAISSPPSSLTAAQPVSARTRAAARNACSGDS